MEVAAEPGAAVDGRPGAHGAGRREPGRQRAPPRGGAGRRARAAAPGDGVELVGRGRRGPGCAPEDAEGVFGRFVRGGSAAAGGAPGSAWRSSGRSPAPTGGRRASRDRDGRQPPAVSGLGSPALRLPAGARHTPGVVPEVLRYRAFRDVWLASLASNAGLVAADRRERLADPADHRQPRGRRRAGAGDAGAGDRACRPSRASSPTASTGAPIGIWTFLLQAAAAGALAVITGLTGPEVWSIYVLTFLVGVGLRPRACPAMLALIPTLVPSAAPLAGGEPERRGHQRRAPGRAGDRRRRRWRSSAPRPASP